ncbi:hypothetical protein QCB44_01015 [Thiomicrorhabdus sp. zzn3]|uniref:hypothetical protein n=1 Tax=Thiomicrorhabdus sp. zzn3 TaxID=3039775 RepID=UPI002436CF6E|nr:hypothetical protein [Thiomicrorhabdus sp. zzn3]MDG6777276.1 hypothetical protein [Thiomicrorhabdus sp. zzn3]
MKSSLFSVIHVTLDEFKRLLEFLENALLNSPESKKLCEPEQLSLQLRQLYEYLKSIDFSTDKPVRYIDESTVFSFIENKDLIPEIKSDVVKEIIVSRFNEICDEVSKVSGLGFDSLLTKRIQQRLNRALSIADRLIRIAINPKADMFPNYQPFVFYKTNRDSYLFKVKNRYSGLGTCVVLDATASVNEFYKLADRSSFSRIALVDVPQIRQYKNLSIYKAKGFGQSRYAIFNDEDVRDKNIEQYLSFAKSLLGKDDKLLIIGHKEFIEHIEQHTNDVRMFFTHWGNHIGRNDWNKCNKVMVVGWNYLQPIEDVSRIYGTGTGSLDLFVTKAIDSERVKQFRITQIVDDIVQAVMRSRARVISTPDSDCQSASIYLFYPDNEEGREIIQLVEEQFPQAQVQDWTPQGITHTKKKSKPEQNADLILEILESKIEYKEESGEEFCSWKDVREESGLRTSDFSKAVNSEYFEDGLAALGCRVEMINGKDKKFTF